jgi:hypothetical protein
VAVVGIHVSMLFTVYGVLFRNVLGIPLRRLLADIAPGAVSSCALAAAAVPTLGLMHGLGAPTFFALAAVGLVGAAVYLLALRALFPAAWSDLAMLVRRLRPEGFLVRRPVTEPAA